MTRFEFQSTQLEETQRLGRELGTILRNSLTAQLDPESASMTLALYGEMGSGKTTFTQGVAAGLGVPGPVTSPTFTLVNEYEIELPSTGTSGKSQSVDQTIPITLIHMDSYRLVGSSSATDSSAANGSSSQATDQLGDDVTLDAATFGMEEIFDTPRSLIIIEWANRLQSILPADHLAIYFDYALQADESAINHRLLQISANGPQSAALLGELEDACG